MARDRIGKRIARLEGELAELRAIHEADDEMRRQIEDEPYGLDRLRNVKRLEEVPADLTPEDDDD
ncbi:hypothetical protein HJD18_10450 [Thermoleophilia bacterium SCSIO 60948]|nr:hypothetical protein HJD18_10450 [Thermoleophilia bacterium SCSIO 60948]